MNKAIMINLAIVIIMFCFFSWKTNNIEDKYNSTTETLQAQMTENTQELKNYISDTDQILKNIETNIIDLQANQESLHDMQASLAFLQEENVASEIEENNEILSTSDKWEINEEVPLPDLPTNMKYCTDYRWYGIEGTPHNRMQNLSYTDEIGCRKYNDDYCVGLGSFYSNRIGDRFEVTLENGNVFTVITGDMKADCDTDSTNMYAPCVNYEGEYCANVIEFIIDDKVVSDDMYAYGSLDYHEDFKGDIIKMVYLGRDNSMDWDSYE